MAEAQTLDVPLPENTQPDNGIISGPLIDPTAMEDVTPEGMNVPASFWQSFRGAARSGTIAGASVEATNQAVARGQPMPKSDRQRIRETVAKIDGPAYPDLTEQNTAAKREMAIKNVAEQVMYDLSPNFQSGIGVAGSLAGAIIAPENAVGMQGFLATRIPMMAGNTIRAAALRAGTEAAIMNTATDPLVQSIRLQSGASKEYDWTQTALAPVVGLAGGAAIGGAVAGAGRALERLGSPDIPDLARPSNQEIMRALDPENAQLTVSRLPEQPEPLTASEVRPVETQPNVSAIRPVQQPPQPERPLNLSTQAGGTLAPVTQIGNVQLSAPQSISLPSIRRDLGLDIPGTLIESPGSIKAFHGTPHDFDKFDLSKIGTGEGNQAYGHGLYFAESKGVAEVYSGVQGRASIDPIANVASKSIPSLGDTPALRDHLKRIFPKSTDAEIEKSIGEAKSPAPGSIYEVRINADPEKFLDWDKPLSQQTPAVRDTMRRLGVQEQKEFEGLSNRIGGYGPNVTKDIDGGDAYKLLQEKLSIADANNELIKSGIVGIRYLDGGFRRAGEGSSNYVVFDENLIQIVSKNGEVLRKPMPLVDFLKGQAEAKPIAPQTAAAKFPPAAEVARVLTQETTQAPAGSIKTFAKDLPPTPGQPAGIFMFDAPNLKVDARRFQFKENGDEQGITNALKSVAKWDAAKGNQVIVWQSKAGELFVVDGHQRTGLARRLIEAGKESKIELPGILYREGDGFSESDIRAIAAAKNIAEGSGSPIDGAKVLRDRPELLDGTMPTSRTEARQAFELARLDDESFRMVTNEVVPYQYAAVVGRFIPDDGPRQQAAMKALSRFEPRNESEASVLVQRVSQSELAKGEGETGSLFGDMMGTESTAGEEMRIVARAIQELKKDKTLLSRVVANADRIEQVGSTIDRQAASGVAQEAETFGKIIAANAYSAGPIRAQLVKIAKEVKDGKQTVNEAAQSILAAVRREVEGNVSARAGDSGRVAKPAAGESSPARQAAIENPASWVIRNKETKEVIIETFDPKKVAALNTEKYEAVPILQYLEGLNRRPDAGGLAVERTDAGQQTLIPGVDPVTDKQRLDIAASKPLRGGNADLPTGGIFDETAINQTSLFRRRPKGELETVGNQISEGRPLAENKPLGNPVNGEAPIAGATVKSLQDISRTLVADMGIIARTGHITPGALGEYKIRSGVVRIRNYGDLDTLTHEIGHAIHIGGGFKKDIDAILRNNIPELGPHGAGKGKEAEAEAFAELFALYALNKPRAEVKFPNAARELDALMREKFPQEAQVIDRMRDQLDILHRAPSADVVGANQISAPQPGFRDKFREFVAKERDPFGRTVFSAHDAMYTNYVDKYHPIYKTQQALVEIARKNGQSIDIRPVDDAYIMSRMLDGTHGAADTQLKYGVLEKNGILPDGPSLSSGIEKALGQKFTAEGFNDFGAYAIARRMVSEYERFLNHELDRPPGALSLGDYQRAVAQFEAKYPTFKEGIEDIYGFQKNHLLRMFDKGLISREMYDSFVAKQDYVPLARDMRDFADDQIMQSSLGGGGKGLLVSSVAKKFRGSDRMVMNPLESIFKRVHDIEGIIAKNDTIGALARMSEHAGPGSGFIVEPIPNHKLTPQRTDVIEALRAAGRQAGEDGDELQVLIQQTEDLLGDSTWTTLFRQKEIEPGSEPIVFHWENGERKAYRLGDKKLGRELYHSLTAMSDVEKNVFLNTMYIAQAALRTGVTRSLDFILVNFVRDQATATLTAGKSYIPFYSAARGLLEAIQKTDTAVAYAGRGGLAGGAIVEAIDASGFGRNVKALQSPGTMAQILKAFEFSETGTRVGLYKSYFDEARKIGMDDVNANLWATFRANDYIDFRRHGAQMGMMRKIVPFLNASVQGSDKELRSVGALVQLEAKRAQGIELSTAELQKLSDARVALVRLTAMGVVLGGGLAAMNAENPRYQNQPDYVKNQNFVIPMMGYDITIPKGFGVVQSFVNAFERAVDYANRNDPNIGKEWLTSAASSFVVPMNNPLVNTYMDVSANYNRFRETPIVPYYLQGVDAPQQFSAFTSGLARTLGEKTGTSPAKLDYIFTNMGGGMARDVMFAWDSLMRNDKPEKQIYDYPVARRFVKNLDRGSLAQKRFYDIVGNKVGELEKKENSYRHLVTSGLRDDAKTLLSGMSADERVWTVLNTGGFSTTVKRMHPLYRAREYTDAVNGMIKQLGWNNVVKEESLDRTNLTVSRREATPMQTDPRQRALLMEELTSLNVAVMRNAMVSVGAKGSTGLGIMPVNDKLDRIKKLSPAIYEELNFRLGKKILPDQETSFKNWPEIKRRIMIDGEDATFDDIAPAKRRRARSR